MNVYSTNKNYAKINRADFLETLAVCLTKPNIERWIFNKNLPKSLRFRGWKLLELEEEIQTEKFLKLNAQVELGNVFYVDEHGIKAQVIHAKLVLNGYAAIISNINAIVVI